ncbi:MAG TPA: N-acetyl-alpha-D-glucosaminyl L-malate synthase BshA [Polyangia bacterium]
MMRLRSSLRIGIACFSSFGGSGVVAAEIGMALGRRGHRVCFLSDKPPARLDPACPNVTYHGVEPLDYPLLAERSYALALTAKMIEVARAQKLDLFHLHYAIPHAVSAFLARQVLGASSPKIVTTLHGTDVSMVGADPRFQPLTQFVVRQSDAITVPSQWLAEAAYQDLGLPRDMAIEVIPNFVDIDKFCPPDEGAKPAATAGAARRPRVLTHVSNFRPLKRLDDVVHIFAAVRAEIPSRLNLVGEGPERSRIEAVVKSLGLADHVRFWGERGDLVEILQGSDVFLLPSETESFGLAALEAMACGVPVVASDVGGVSEVVADGETGFLAVVGDVAGMAGHARRLLSDETLRRRMSIAARHRAVQNYRPAPAIDRYEDAYSRALGG